MSKIRNVEEDQLLQFPDCTIPNSPPSTFINVGVRGDGEIYLAIRDRSDATLADINITAKNALDFANAIINAVMEATNHGK